MNYTVIKYHLQEYSIVFAKILTILLLFITTVHNFKT